MGSGDCSYGSGSAHVNRVEQEQTAWGPQYQYFERIQASHAALGSVDGQPPGWKNLR